MDKLIYHGRWKKFKSNLRIFSQSLGKYKPTFNVFFEFEDNPPTPTPVAFSADNIIIRTLVLHLKISFIRNVLAMCANPTRFFKISVINCFFLPSYFNHISESTPIRFPIKTRRKMDSPFPLIIKYPYLIPSFCLLKTLLKRKIIGHSIIIEFPAFRRYLL